MSLLFQGLRGTLQHDPPYPRHPRPASPRLLLHDMQAPVLLEECLLTPRVQLQEPLPAPRTQLMSRDTRDSSGGRRGSLPSGAVLRCSRAPALSLRWCATQPLLGRRESGRRRGKRGKVRIEWTTFRRKERISQEERGKSSGHSRRSLAESALYCSSLPAIQT